MNFWRSLQERIFSVIISFLALINFSTMVSSMTSLLEAWRIWVPVDTLNACSDVWQLTAGWRFRFQKISMDPYGLAETKEWFFLWKKWGLPVIEASLQKLKNDEVEQFGLLRSYLGYNNIDQDLSHRVTRFLQRAFDLKNRAISKDVARPWIVFVGFSRDIFPWFRFASMFRGQRDFPDFMEWNK